MMRYLHTMVRITDIEESLKFFCDILGFSEINRKENEQGRFTLIFLAAPHDKEMAENTQAPMIELTYNWPSDGAEPEMYTGGRNFGHLAYIVDDIYAICARAQDMGVVINRPPRDGHMAFIRSPDGISIELLQNGGPLPLQEPWASMQNTGTW